MPFDRSSGLLLHIASLPSLGGIGDLGPAAYAFADFLAAAKQRLWQVLPLGPTGYGNSPYAALSAFAGNPLLDLARTPRRPRLDRPRPPRQAPRPRRQRRFRSRRRKQNCRCSKKPPATSSAITTPRSWRATRATARANGPGSMTTPSSPSSAANSTAPPGTTGRAIVAHRDPAALDRLRREHSRRNRHRHRPCSSPSTSNGGPARTTAQPRGIRFIGDIAIFVNYDSRRRLDPPRALRARRRPRPRSASPACRPTISPPPASAGAIRSTTGTCSSASGFDWWVDRIRRASSALRHHPPRPLPRLRGLLGHPRRKTTPPSTATGSRRPAPSSSSALQDALGPASLHRRRPRPHHPGSRCAARAIRPARHARPPIRLRRQGAHIHLPHRYVSRTPSSTPAPTTTTPPSAGGSMAQRRVESRGQAPTWDIRDEPTKMSSGL